MDFSEFEDRDSIAAAERTAGRDPSHHSPDSAGEEAAISSVSNSGEGRERQSRRSPPPLPEEGSTFAGTEDWLDEENGQGSHRESPRGASSRPSDPSLQAGRDEGSRVASEKGEQKAAAGSPRAGERPGQALVPRRSVPSSRGYDGSARSSAYAGRGGSGYRSDYSRSAAYGYTSGYVGGGGYGGGGRSGSSAGGVSSSGLTVVVVVALLAFFGGFAIRNIFAERGGFDDERPIRAANVPAAFRDFCFAYNGTASFTVVQLTSVSALTMASVPIYKMDTCTIPVSQTANALQALGIRGRADTLGPQLGGSNLTLIQLPLASSLARAVYNQFPGLAAQGNEAQVLSQLETTINNALRSNIEGLALQSLEPTNIPDVYVMVPGHSFNLQPQLNLR
ncbi:MAG TPA: hypothetical protein IGR15_12295 [Synechococcus sp. M44_DOE_062]|nr:hypothetical protein [Synechococcus sp. M44_DOE_062]